MNKIWYVKIEGEERGPFSLLQLKNVLHITPDTLVRKEGKSQWVKARDVPELSPLFTDDEPLEQEEENLIKYSDDTLVLDINKEPPYLVYWLVLVLLILVYTTSKLYGLE